MIEKIVEIGNLIQANSALIIVTVTAIMALCIKILNLVNALIPNTVSDTKLGKIAAGASRVIMILNTFGSKQTVVKDNYINNLSKDNYNEKL